MRHTITHAALFGLCISSVSVYAAEDAISTQFHALDTNSNGTITLDELRAQPKLVQTLHIYGNDNFHHADHNGNGLVDKAEFSAFEEPISAE